MSTPITASHPDVPVIRAFNRFYTRKIGVLQYSQITKDLSLTEARVLFELAQAERSTPSHIAAELELDAGYLSRILRKFEERGWLSRKASKDDARQSILSLTKSGRTAFRSIDDRSNEHAEQLLSGLSSTDRRRLVTAMNTIEELLGDAKPAAPVVLRAHTVGDLGWIIQRHGEVYDREYNWGAQFETLVAKVCAEIWQNFDPGKERCWIAERDGERIGTVTCVKGDDPSTAKLRMLLVEKQARGLGLGRMLVRECIRFARAAGYKRLTLWTNSVLIAARNIYESEGFVLVKEEPHQSFGKDLIGEYWELEL